MIGTWMQLGGMGAILVIGFIVVSKRSHDTQSKKAYQVSFATLAGTVIVFTVLVLTHQPYSVLLVCAPLAVVLPLSIYLIMTRMSKGGLGQSQFSVPMKTKTPVPSFDSKIDATSATKAQPATIDTTIRLASTIPATRANQSARVAEPVSPSGRTATKPHPRKPKKEQASRANIGAQRLNQADAVDIDESSIPLMEQAEHAESKLKPSLVARRAEHVEPTAVEPGHAAPTVVKPGHAAPTVVKPGHAKPRPLEQEEHLQPKPQHQQAEHVEIKPKPQHQQAEHVELKPKPQPKQAEHVESKSVEPMKMPTPSSVVPEAAISAYQSSMERAAKLKKKGLYAAAAALFLHAAEIARDDAEENAAEFRALSCYIESGDYHKTCDVVERLQAKTASLSSSERIKLKALLSTASKLERQ